MSPVLTTVKQLIEWQQTRLLPKKEIRFQFSRKDFSLVNQNGERITDLGRI